jgi:DNA-binding transcriptional regulator YiaG
MEEERDEGWSGARVRRLRRWLQMTQRAFADELGVRQQTVSEWETGVYQPRGASTRLLGIVAERAGFTYGQEAAADAEPPAAGHGV